MKASHVLSILGAALVSAAATPTEPTTESVGMTYIGPITPGGPNHEIHGTVDEIYTQIYAKNPSFNPDDFVDVKLDKRDRPTVPNGAKTLCNPEGDPVDYNLWYAKTFTKLERLPGDCVAPRGPRACVRVACDSGADTAFCNDDPNNEARVNCHLLSDYAYVATATCQSWDNTHRVMWTKGQTFEPNGKWNVIVKRGNC